MTDNGAGDEDTAVGSVCVSGLAPGSYTVNETSPPIGYGSAGQTNVSETVASYPYLWLDAQWWNARRKSRAASTSSYS